MEEYSQAKAKEIVDNGRFIEAIKLMGLEATYFCGQYTVRDNGTVLGKKTAAEWLDDFKAILGQINRN